MSEGYESMCVGETEKEREREKADENMFISEPTGSMRRQADDEADDDRMSPEWGQAGR